MRNDTRGGGGGGRQDRYPDQRLPILPHGRRHEDRLQPQIDPLDRPRQRIRRAPAPAPRRRKLHETRHIRHQQTQPRVNHVPGLTVQVAERPRQVPYLHILTAHRARWPDGLRHPGRLLQARHERFGRQGGQDVAEGEIGRVFRVDGGDEGGDNEGRLRARELQR